MCIRRQRQRGFTLIEIIAVISAVGLFVAGVSTLAVRAMKGRAASAAQFLSTAGTDDGLTAIAQYEASTDTGRSDTTQAQDITTNYDAGDVTRVGFIEADTTSTKATAGADAFDDHAQWLDTAW